jgi:Protein of unknown function (DUF1588)/Protein of unknown function (DUF1592)
MALSQLRPEISAFRAFSVKKLLAAISLLALSCQGNLLAAVDPNGGNVPGATGARPPDFVPPTDIVNRIEEAKKTAEADAQLFFSGTSKLPLSGGLWRKTTLELNEIYISLLGPQASLISALGEDSSVRGVIQVRGVLAAQLTQDWYKNYLNAHAGLSSDSKATEFLRRLFSCTNGEPKADCFSRLEANVLIRIFGTRLSPEVRAAYEKIFNQAPDAAGAIHAVVKAALRSPFFVLRTEVGASPEVAEKQFSLSTAEIASSMAHATGTPETLATRLSAAEGAKLGTRNERAAFLRSALDSVEGAQFITRLYLLFGSAQQWQRLSKDETLFPKFDQPLRDDMHTQARLTLERVFLARTASAVEAMTTRQYWMNGRLGGLYQTPVTADGFTAVDPKQRAGFLTLAGVQAAMSGTAESKPMFRAKSVLDRLLCANIGFPANPEQQAQSATDNGKVLSVKERFTRLETMPACGSCHAALNPIGLSLENYDAAGAFRSAYATGDAIDASIVVKSGALEAGNYQNASQVIEAVALSKEHWQCMVQQAYSYLTGLNPEEHPELMRRAYVDFVKSDLSVRELFVSLLADDTLYLRGTP